MGPSVQQLLIVLLIILVLFGAKKIPELAKGMGKGIKNFKKEMEDDTVEVKEDEKLTKETSSEEVKSETKEAQS